MVAEQCFIVAKVFCGFQGVLIVFFTLPVLLAAKVLCIVAMVLFCWSIPSVNVNCCVVARGFYMVAKLLLTCCWDAVGDCQGSALWLLRCSVHCYAADNTLEVVARVFLGLCKVFTMMLLCRC